MFLCVCVLDLRRIPAVLQGSRLVHFPPSGVWEGGAGESPGGAECCRKCTVLVVRTYNGFDEMLCSATFGLLIFCIDTDKNRHVVLSW